MCVVIDLDLVCLVCVEPCKGMHSVFAADGDDPEMKISQKISILSELKVDRNNKSFPSKICSKCLQDLKSAWRFRKNCQAAVTIFQTIIKLDDVLPETSATNELAEKQIKAPHCSHRKHISIENDYDEVKEDVETLNLKTVSTKEFINNSDKIGTALYEELELQNDVENQHEEADEFQKVEDDDENEQDGMLENDDESTLVEYYITDDGPTDESTIKVYNKKPTNANMMLTQVVEKNTHFEENQMKPTTRVSNINKRQSKGRQRNQNMSQKEAPKSTNIPQTKTKGRVILDSSNGSAKATQPEVRQVKTRKRKSLSLEAKTPKICEICGNSYRYQHALNAHMRRHYNDKPFPCECCDKAFVSNVELRRHMRVHTGQKPYACQYCERRFSDFGSRIKHERTHTGERPYHCVTCGKSFAYPHVLSVHVRTHTGEKRFRCEYCTKGFTKKAYLISHVNQHHSSHQVVLNETMERRQSHLKPETFECIFTSQFENDEAIDETEEYDDDSNQGPTKIIITQSLMEPKSEADNEAEEIVELQPDEYTIRVR